MKIVAATSGERLACVRMLFKEYWSSFGFTPCFQDFAGELAALPGKYVPPDGRLALAEIDGNAAGCVALRRFDPARGEVKRLYVRPNSRGLGVGRALLQWIIAEARTVGYRELVCDTIPVMEQALAMYDRAGFQRTEPYSAEATPGAVYFRLTL